MAVAVKVEAVAVAVEVEAVWWWRRRRWWWRCTESVNIFSKRKSSSQTERHSSSHAMKSPG